LASRHAAVAHHFRRHDRGGLLHHALLLVKLVRQRKHLNFGRMFWMFAAFILLCGATQIAIKRKSEERLRLLNSELEQRVAERTAALERSNQDLTQFAYIASHDLQEPLRMVSTYTDLLQKRYGPGLNEEAQTFMKYAADGSRRMQELISDLLTYSQIERDAIPFRATSAGSAVDRALESLRLAIDQQNARIRVEPLPIVYGDEGQLAQVFQNLISNSLKYRSQVTPEIHIWAVPEGKSGEWKFYVKDNGASFDMKFKDRLFNMFQRLETRQPGTGIGLALCKKSSSIMAARSTCNRCPVWVLL
jgi:light-regulated signal transduction histidine kinase (bacteriophytochrome)